MQLEDDLRDECERSAGKEDEDNDDDDDDDDALLNMFLIQREFSKVESMIVVSWKGMSVIGSSVVSVDFVTWFVVQILLSISIKLIVNLV